MAPRKRTRALVFRMATALAALGALALVAELGIRVAVPADRWLLRDSTRDMRIDPTLGWVRAPNLDSSRLDSISNEVIRTRTNADGLMPADAVPTRRPGVTRILLVGDSTIAGSGVREEERIHVQLRERLGALGIDAEVINSGTEGWATDQAMLRMGQLIDRYAPDGILHCVCANDFAGIKSTSFNGINKPTFELDEQGRLVAVPFEPTDELQAYVDRDSLVTRLVQRSATYRVLRPNIIKLRARLAGWEERNLLGLTDEWYHAPEELERVDWALFSALIARMRDIAAERQVGFAVYAHPAVGAVWDPVMDRLVAHLGGRAYDRFAVEDRIAREVESVGVSFIPIAAYFVERQERGPFHLLPRDPHCNAAGYRLQAEVLAAHVASDLAP